eukprot:scaffold108614_cov42-Phaeocystis_antarctica.AAC.1
MHHCGGHGRAAVARALPRAAPAARQQQGAARRDARGARGRRRPVAARGAQGVPRDRPARGRGWRGGLVVDDAALAVRYRAAAARPLRTAAAAAAARPARHRRPLRGAVRLPAGPRLLLQPAPPQHRATALRPQ